MIQDRFVTVTAMVSIQKLIYLVCTVAKVKVDQNSSKLKARKFVMIETIDAETYVKDWTQNEYIVFKLGHIKAHMLYRRDTFSSIKELITEFDNTWWNTIYSDSCEEEIGNPFPSRIAKPHKTDLELLSKCECEYDIAIIESFAHIPDDSRDTERLKALRNYDRRHSKNWKFIISH